MTELLPMLYEELSKKHGEIHVLMIETENRIIVNDKGVLHDVWVEKKK